MSEHNSFTTATARLQELGDQVADAELVSGLRCTDDRVWRHVWVELAGEAHDLAANGRPMQIPVAIFYAGLRIHDRAAIPGAEVLRMLGQLETLRKVDAKRALVRLMRRLRLSPPASLLSALWCR